MNPTLLVPLLASVAAGAIATAVQHRLQPRRGTQVLTVTVVVCALAVVGALLMLVIGWIARYEWVAERLGWCQSLATHAHGSAVIGIAALAALLGCGVGAGRSMSRHRAAAGSPGVTSIEILPIPDLIAHAVPGRPGHVVVSTGTLEVLGPEECQAMLAHEHAHLRHHHHRYVSAGDVAAGAVPFLRPMSRRLRYATERWADEDAAHAVGDREVVARAIIRMALAVDGQASAGHLAIGAVGVPSRVEALLAGPPSFGPAMALAAALATSATVGAVAASTIQLHHVLAFAHHVCP